MIFKIDPASQKPVYQQLIDQVKYAVAAGRLSEGDRLPPIRDVAVQARLNRNTVARAYSELEREGVIFSRAGQGSFIAPSGTSIAASRAKKQLSEQLDALLAQAHQFGYSKDDILALFSERLGKLQLQEGD